MPGKRKVTEIIFGASLDPFSKETRGHVVGSNRWGGVYALDRVTREFPGHFRNFVFMSACTVDAKSYSGSGELDRVRKRTEQTLGYLIGFCSNRRLASKACVGFDGFSHSICLPANSYSSTTTGIYASSIARPLLTMLRRLHLLNMPMVVLPMKCKRFIGSGVYMTQSI